jgi:hypothetical protein
MTNENRIPVIVCGGKTGRAVIFGYVDVLPEVDQPVDIYDARMVLYWSEQCGGLFGLATNGPKEGTRITCPVDHVQDTARQILTVSADAATALREWPDA